MITEFSFLGELSLQQWLMVVLILSVFILCWVSFHLLLFLLSFPAYARGCREEAAARIRAWTSLGRPQCQAAGDWPSAEGKRSGFPTTPYHRIELKHRLQCTRPCVMLKASGVWLNTLSKLINWNWILVINCFTWFQSGQIWFRWLISWWVFVRWFWTGNRVFL